MKLLIITQKIDRNDPILGFFHRWVEEFSKHCEKLTVICLQKGEYSLPDNTKVLSLGKEEGLGKLEYIIRFYKYIKQEESNYDHVFVHMNQEYVLLGAVAWKTWGKKIYMWRNHPKGNFLTDLAVYLSDKVFCTSKFSYTAKFNKTEIMPVGIDTNFFKREHSVEKNKNSILFLGRISPIKKPDLFIEALNILNKKGVKFTATIVGDPLPKDDEYFDTIKNKISEYKLNDIVKIEHSVPNFKTPEIYNKHDIYINLTPSGSLDKTIFEAMATESLVLVSNDSLRGKIEDIFVCKEGEVNEIANKLRILLEISEKEKIEQGKGLREFVGGEHSLNKLSKNLFEIFKC